MLTTMNVQPSRIQKELVTFLKQNWFWFKRNLKSLNTRKGKQWISWSESIERLKD